MLNGIKTHFPGSYRIADCRSGCLQRHIWETCGCLDIALAKPFFVQSMLCGFTNTSHQIIFPHVHNLSHCFDRENLMLPECKDIFTKLFQDIECIQRVKTLHMNHASEDVYKCHCPPPCLGITFDSDYSLAAWPSPGFELNSAYAKIVEEKVIPHFKKDNLTLAKELVDYFSNKDNKEEVMRNFARFTVYIKDLTVLTSQQVPAYSELDLLSDIGE